MISTDIIDKLRNTLPVPERRDDVVDTSFQIYQLLISSTWSDADLFFISMIQKKLEINRNLSAYYTLDWKRTGNTMLAEPWYSVLFLIFYQSFMRLISEPISETELYKKANVLLKALDRSEAVWLGEKKELYTGITALLLSRAGSIVQTDEKDIEKLTTTDRNDDKKTLPLTVLFYEGPIARAYLSTLYGMGYKPNRIIHLISSNDLATGKKLGTFLPRLFRERYAFFVQKLRIQYWQKYISKNHLELKNALLKQVSSRLGFPESILADAYAGGSLKKYSQNIDRLMINGLRDQKLQSYLQRSPASVLLYTGGGILPTSLLSLPNIKFLHMHPGFLPLLRGADCLLWSILLKGRPSVSSFYMSEGIDMGEIIDAEWLPPLSCINYANYDPQLYYRSLLIFIDPWVRCIAIRKIVNSYTDFMKIPSQKQNAKEGDVYHFMHREIQKVVFMQKGT
jgi:hypothetical protein